MDKSKGPIARMMRTIEAALNQAMTQNLFDSKLSPEATKQMVILALKHEWKNYGFPDVDFVLTESDDGSSYIIEYFRNGKKQGVDYRSGKLQLFDAEDDGTTKTSILLAKPI